MFDFNWAFFLKRLRSRDMARRQAKKPTFASVDLACNRSRKRLGEGARVFCRSMRITVRRDRRSLLVTVGRFSVFLSAQFEFDLPNLYPNG